jgi:hypothetical protein
MKKETQGQVISVSRQWWLKVNTKAVRLGPMDGAVFPHIIKVSYAVNGREYTKRKWIGAGKPVPMAESTVKVLYDVDHPAKAEIIF